MDSRTPDFSERRREPRHLVKDVLVKLSLGNGTDPITCFVWDMSRSGMRLKLPTRMALPALVYVTVANVQRPARVAWAKGDQIGLELIQADVDSPSAMRADAKV